MAGRTRSSEGRFPGALAITWRVPERSGTFRTRYEPLRKSTAPTRGVGAWRNVPAPFPPIPGGGTGNTMKTRIRPLVTGAAAATLRFPRWSTTT